MTIKKYGKQNFLVFLTVLLFLRAHAEISPWPCGNFSVATEFGFHRHESMDKE